MIKKSSSEVTSSSVIYASPCLYYGFVCVTGGTARTIKLYDNATTTSGTIVESFVAAADKPTDGHSHSNPVECSNGLYLSMSGGTVVVFYAPIPNNTKDGTRLAI